MISYDSEGHGYSEGDRGLIRDWRHLRDDVIDFITLIYGDHLTSDKCNLSCPCLHDVRSRQLVMIAESIGGGISLAACIQLQKSEKPELRPRALLLSAPFLQAKVPFGASKSFAAAVQTLPFKNVGLPSMFLPPIQGTGCFLQVCQHICECPIQF